MATHKTKIRRTPIDKLNTLLFGKDLRVTKGDCYTEEREYDYTSYYPVEKYISTQAPPSEGFFDIRDYGAVADDKSIDNAAAINACISDCAKQGGVVLVDGGDYSTGTVYLKSNISLFVAGGSSLVANESGQGFEQALILCRACENITITGGGTIDGNGHLFGRRPVADSNITEPAEVIDVIQMRRDNRAQLRFAHPSKYGRLCQFEDCRNITVNNIILKDSAYWTLKLTRCNGVKVENLVINDNRNVCNTDGIDLMQSSNVDIRHCFISSADDGIVLKNAAWEGCTESMENISVNDCEVISRTNAFKIGTETTHPIRNVTVNNCRFLMTDLYPGTVSGISIESADGSEVRDITCENIEMHRCTCPIFIRLCNRNRAAKVNMQSASAIEFGVKAKGKGFDKKSYNMKGSVKNIVIRNITADGVELPVIIAGFRQKGKTRRVSDVLLENISITYRDAPEVIDRRLFIPEYSRVYPECWRFRNLPAYALWIRHAENITINGFSCAHPHQTWRKHTVTSDLK